jgi:hypothetical protein
MAVHVGGDVQAVPMDDAFFRQLIGEVDAYLLPSPQVQNGTEVAVGNGLQGVGIPLQQFAPLAPAN